MANLDSLSPARRAQYEALLPEIKRSAQSVSNARGGFYSGAATDAETRAEADLLAKLAGQDASEQAAANENAKNRELQQNLNDQSVKAGKRQALLGIVGSGVGASATLAGLKYMHPSVVGGGGIWQMGPNGTLFNSQTGEIRGAPMAAAPGVGGAALGSTAPTGLGALGGGAPMVSAAPGFDPAGWNPVAAAPGVGGAAPATAPTSMWSSPGASLGAGAVGGLAGSQLSNLIAGRGGRNNDIGAAAGGIAGLGAGMYMSGGNPWMAGLGALGGSLGGGLLGNLFR